ncbi:hypothetical protein ARMGADRAFT_1084630 [Armillaria gallica]|uniref:Uncharacterized protein n=1 Tax=Armillaria gallica TaxID=47427 RepID=A0A2H3DJ70_ARMGA|nr:hypothetical protein ARMGADRAFT_1084630 [Armillaria gallica]
MSTPQDPVLREMSIALRQASPKQALRFGGRNKRDTGRRIAMNVPKMLDSVQFYPRAPNPRVATSVCKVQVGVIEGDGGDGGDDDDDARSHSLLSFLGWLPKYRFLRSNDVLQTQESSIVYGALALRRLPSTPRILTLPSTRTSDATCFVIWYNILLKWTVGDTGSQSDELYLPGNLSRPRWSNTLILSPSALLVQRHSGITTRSLCTRPSKRTETERMKDGQYMLTRRVGENLDDISKLRVYVRPESLGCI